MARVTVEDCVEVVKNRFELVALASERAKNIAAGSPLTVERDNDKNAVIALREIADRTVETDALREAVIQNSQRYAPADQDIAPAPETDEEHSEMSSGLTDELKSFSHHDDEVVAEDDSDASAEDLQFQEDNLDVDD